MRSEIECRECGKVIGEHVTYPLTCNGQDPPEDIYFHEEAVVFDEAGNPFCSPECQIEYWIRR